MYALLTIALAALINVAIFTTLSHAQQFVYPTNGQSPQQQEQDEFACHKWAKGQTGMDPMQPTQAAAAPPPKRRGGMLSGAMGGAGLGARLARLWEEWLERPEDVRPKRNIASINNRRRLSKIKANRHSIEPTPSVWKAEGTR
jgi:hypothetical protein